MTDLGDTPASPPPAPWVAVFPRGRKGPGLNCLAEAEHVAPAHVCSLSEALLTKWDHDAHFACYSFDDFDPACEHLYRINRTCLPEIAKAGGRLVLNYVCFDRDTGKGELHVPWTRESWADFMEEVDRAMSGPFGALLRRACAFHPTLKGARWIFRLHPAVPVAEADSVIWGLLTMFKAAGIKVDEDADGWNRLFRLPHVHREDKAGPSWEAPFYAPPEISEEAWIPSGPESIPRVFLRPAAPSDAAPVRSNESMPSVEEVDALLWERKDGILVGPTPFCAAAREQLKGRDYAPYIFEAKAPDFEARHKTIVAWARGAASMLTNVEGMNAARLYALFLPVAEGLEDDEDWEYDTWRSCRTAWEKELGQKAVEEARRAEEVARLEVVPTPEESNALLYVLSSNGNMAQSAYATASRNRLRKCSYSAVMFGNEIPAAVSLEDVRGWVADAIPKVSTLPDADEFRVFALVHKIVEQLGPDATRGLWGFVKEEWAQEKVRLDAIKAKQEEDRSRQKALVEDLSETILRGVRSWPETVGIPLDDPSAWEWVKDRMIVSVGSAHYVMDPTGWYSMVPVSSRQLVAQVRHQGMQPVIPLTRKLAKGEGERIAKYDEITGDHMVVAAELEAKPEIPGGYLDQTEAASPRLIVRSFRRNPKLIPKFDPLVDGWIRSMAWAADGTPLYERLNRHIAYFLAFERGAVCAMFFVFDPGGGKKLAAHGFKETLEFPALAQARDLVDNFNPGLLKSPFLVMNEGIPRLSYSEHISDTVRKLVSGDAHYVNDKNKPLVPIYYPFRLLGTANNYDMILSLGKGRDLAPADREALAQRIQLYSPGSRPVEYLRDIGGMKTTKGWIGGDGSHPSNFVVARHFLWLYCEYGQDAEPNDTHGLLMSGDAGGASLPVEMMRTQGGSTPAVIHTLVRMLNTSCTPAQGIAIEEGRLYVRSGPVQEYWESNLSQGSSDKLTHHKVGAVLKSLVRAGGVHGEKPIRVCGIVQRWHDLDVRMILNEVQSRGTDCKRLEALGLWEINGGPGVPVAPTNGTHQPVAPASLFGGVRV